MEYNHERTHFSLNNMTPAEFIQTLQKDKDIELARGKISHQISQLSKRVIIAFQIYSYVEKTAQSARKLRRSDRVIYNMLYSKNTEILYFIVAKKIDPLIVVTKLNDHTNADELINALADIFYDW
ncbi:hypothetical protein ACS91J_12935 [Pectobacterium carotovorum]